MLQRTRIAFAGGHTNNNITSSSSRSEDNSTTAMHQLLPFPAVPPHPQQQLLCELLRVQPPVAQAILLTCQGVSSMPAHELTAKWQALQQLLPLPQHMLLQAILQLPSLLAAPQQTVAARLDESAWVLGLGQQGQLRARRREQTVQLHWRLLVTPSQQLQQQVEQLVALLGGLPRRHVVQLLCAEPRLLAATTDPAQLLSTVEALEQVSVRSVEEKCTHG